MITKDDLKQKMQAFYWDGFERVKMSDKSKWQTLFKKIISDCDKNIGWNEKYTATFDSKISPVEFSKDLNKFIFDTALIQNVRKISGRDLSLSHSQLRLVKDPKNYTPWHRDSFIKLNGKLHGIFPPPIKLIMYYSENKISKPVLSFKGGSHLKFFKNTGFDKIASFFDKKTDLTPTDGDAILFDTMTYHRANPVADANTYRIILSFVSSNQFGVHGNSNTKAYELHN